MNFSVFRPAFDWQSRAVLGRHLRVHLRNWHTAALPPVFEPLVMLLAFGVGLGRQISELSWAGQPIDYLSYLAPGILAYTAFMTAFFQSLFSAYMRMHFQKSWEGQLTTQVRLEHVIWGEALWAACLATFYALIVCLVLLGFGMAGALQLHWAWPGIRLHKSIWHFLRSGCCLRHCSRALITWDCRFFWSFCRWDFPAAPTFRCRRWRG